MASHPTPQASSEPPHQEDLTPAQRLAIIEEVHKILDRKLKIYGTSLVAVFALLGIATYGDVRRATKEIVRSQVNSLITKADSETDVKRTLDDLVNRSAMTASLISLRRPEESPPDRKVTMRHRRPERELNLSFDSWTRLRAWVKSKDLGQEDFSGTLAVLAAQEEERAQQDAKDFLAEMLNPPVGSQYGWMKNQPAKQLAILEVFLRPGLEYSALAIATGSTRKELKIAAIDHLVALDYRDAFDDLYSAAAAGGNDAIARHMLWACASIDPLNGKIKQEVAKVLATGPATPLTVESAVRLAAAIWYAPSFDEAIVSEDLRSDLEEERRSLVVRLLSYAFENRSRVVILDNDIVAIFNDLEPRSSSVLGISRDAFSRLEPYWIMLREAAAQNNIARISALAPRSAYRTGLNALQLELDDSTAVMVDGAQSSHVALSRARGVSRVVFARSKDSERDRDQIIEVLWTDNSGQESRGVLVGLTGTGFRFSFPKEFH